MEEMEARVDDLKAETASLKKQVDSLQQETIELKKLIAVTETRIDRLSRKHIKHLIFYGSVENKGESKTKLAENMNRFINNKKEMDEIVINSVFRMKTGKANKPGPVIVSFDKLSKREAVFSNRRILRAKNIPVFIAPDLNKYDAARARKNREAKKSLEKNRLHEKTAN
ncbi:unnamed protein product [Allacma fusca]|uniref:Uncharacterized protein n=1 Tax=Allacma fusca TaxID=39272 RepID=A0A8J2PEV9_9HEXA|nr:unnamed protein product [Allacma fusca]